MRQGNINCDAPNKMKHEGLDGTVISIMKIWGALVDILCEMDTQHWEYVAMEGNQKVLYMHITKAIYGLLVSTMLFYKKLIKDLQGYGFKMNPCSPCVANKLVNGEQLTVSWYVDDLSQATWTSRSKMSSFNGSETPTDPLARLKLHGERFTSIWV